MSEATFQSDVAKWLRGRGGYVLIISPRPGIPDGCPDVVALFPKLWITLELKTSEHAKFQPLQEPTIAKLSKMGYSRAVWPKNWEEVKKELQQII
jgi:Holliday junction resolvase